MPRYSIKVDYRAIETLVSNSRQLEEAVHTELEKRVEDAHEEMLAEFNNHLVTKEIEAKNNTSNISNTLLGYGNLFTFIGFFEVETPIAELRNYLSDSIKLNKRASSKRRKRLEFRARIPDLKAIEKITPMPWEASRSWVKGIERGISGLGYYINSKTRKIGHSGGGVQNEEKLRGGRFRPVKYMSEILKNFRKKIGAK